jgi:translation initiation factor 4A
MRRLTEISAGQIESNYDEVTDSFDAMNLKPELLRGENIPYQLTR